jgi:hypothetical protein
MERWPTQPCIGMTTPLYLSMLYRETFLGSFSFFHPEIVELGA